MYYVYILTNKNHTVLYTGVTGNIEKRMYEHKNKLNEEFTQRYNADIMVYCEVFENVEEAIVAEKTIKGWKRIKKVNLIEKDNPEWNNLALNL